MTLKARGQNLVLFALTLLLLTLGVLMTLSFGSRMKSRMEMQTVADAAAYSNAVATARTLNSIAVMNRVQVAHTVSTIGTLSLISWATLYWKHATNARDLWAMEAGIFALGVLVYCLPKPPKPACAPCKNGLIQTALAAALMWINAGNIKNKLQNDVTLFTNETTPRWNANLALFAAQQTMVSSLLAKLQGGAFANQFAAQAKLGGVTSLGAPSGLNQAELDGAIVPNTARTTTQVYHVAQIVNGSRGHPFIPERSSKFGWTWDLTIPWSLPAGISWVDGNSTGRGYLNDTWHKNPSGPPRGQAGGSYAHDWGDRTRTILVRPEKASCTTFGPIALAVGLMGKGTGTNVKVGPEDHPGVHSAQHSFRTIPPFVDYNPANLTDSDNLYGVPKNLSVVSLDLASRREPWDHNSHFQFTQSGARLDLVDRPAAMMGGQQLAIGSGVTYYSRQGHYAEPPNLFAPYWRSTLTRMTVDRPAPGPARTLFDANLASLIGATGQAEARVVFEELVNAGYKGFE